MVGFRLIDENRTPVSASPSGLPGEYAWLMRKIRRVKDLLRIGFLRIGLI